MANDASQSSPSTATPIGEDLLATHLRGFGPLGLLAIFFILYAHLYFVPLAGAMVLVWARLSRAPWRELGLVRPQSWVRSAVIGTVFGVALKFFMKAVTMPLLGAPPVNQSYHYLAGNRAEIPWFLLTILGAGVAEEIVFRGYAFERLSKLLGPGIGVKWAAVLLTAVWFGSAHYLNQGIPGVENAAIIGLVFGAIFVYTGQLFMLMCAHTAVDLAAYALIYWNLESRVAHLIFK